LTPLTNRRRFVLAVVAGWAALALLFAATNSLTYMSTGRPPLWGLSIRMALADWLGWAALTFPVLWLARRWPLDSGRFRARLPMHVVAAVAVAAVKVALDRWVRQAVFGFPVSYFLLSSLVPHFVIYWIVVAAAHALAYYARSRERELAASQLEARLAEARLQLLQMQLQPHFLFNTLHAISELVHESPETADRMIGALSDLLREALDASRMRQVPLDHELHLLGRYLDIQTVRFGDRLEVRFDVAADVRRCLVPSLVLQPLVENAITHGLAARAAAGRIDVSCARLGDRLVIEVADDGAGLAPPERWREGIGLGNTRARLQELYGSGGALDVRHRLSGGVLVKMTIPAYESAHADRG